jgi:hypothetical protein
MNQPNRARTQIAPKSPLKSNYHERVICSLLLLLGFIGLQHIMTSSPKFSPTVYGSPVKDSHLELMPFQSNLPRLANQENREPNRELLQISGHYEAEEKLTFNIPDFHSRVDYELNLGNNQIIDFNQSTETYSYPKPGRYTIQLWGTYEDQKKMLFSRKIKINERIEVDERAFDDLDD